MLKGLSWGRGGMESRDDSCRGFKLERCRAYPMSSLGAESVSNEAASHRKKFIS